MAILQKYSFCLYKHIWKVHQEWYCITHDALKKCFLTNCRCRFLLLRNAKGLLRKLDALCFTFQRVYILYTLLIYKFSNEVLVKSGQISDKVQRSTWFNQIKRKLDKILKISRKDSLGKNREEAITELFPKDKSTQASLSTFAEGIDQIKKNNFEQKHISFVDFFKEGYGNYNNIEVTWEGKPLEDNRVLNPGEVCNRQLLHQLK